VAAESPYVATALEVARAILQPPLDVQRGAPLLYQLPVNNRLQLTVDPADPRRAKCAYQTDLCVFERIDDRIEIPRVVLEFKTKFSTHDVIVYSAKARRHKQIYPYLRYGMVASDQANVAGRLFNHNEGLDFCAAVAGLADDALRDFFSNLIAEEIEASRRLESIFFGAAKTRLFRSAILI
jgi:hypothetical protein